MGNSYPQLLISVSSLGQFWRSGTPAFVNPNAGDYHISPASAAVDRGVDAGVYDDLDGDHRPQGWGYDIGADELEAALPIVNTAWLTDTEGEWSISTTVIVNGRYFYLPLVIRSG